MPILWMSISARFGGDTAGSSRFFKVMNITPEARSLESPMGLARRLIMMWIAGAGLLVSASPMA